MIFGINKYSVCAALAVISSFNPVHGEENLKSATLDVMNKIKVQYDLPSLSVAVGVDGNIVFSKAIGFSDVDKKQSATIKTQYSVGSLAKPMTGIALAKLVDSNKLKLESTVSSYVKHPEYTSLFSVKELAAHIAGIPHDTAERDIAEFVYPRDHKSPFDSFYVFESQPLLFTPGTQYKYSSNGYILLSAVIEKAANMDYVNFLKTSLWSQFEMDSTELDTSFAGKKYEATYYAEYKGDGKYLGSTKKRDRSFLFGGGGFITTPTDLIKMSQATYHETYLSVDTRQMLYTPVKLRNGTVNSDKYSLGWRVGGIKLNDNEQYWVALHHGGVTDKASTAYLLVIPECKASIAFTTNYIPPKFWKIRGEMAKLLKSYIDVTQCSKLIK